MAVGFTGTRSGMTKRQEDTLRIYLEAAREKFGPEFRHGVARGSDLRAAEIAVSLGYKEKKFPAGDDPLGRNKVIVDGADFMFATPQQYHEAPRPGTWMAIRYANRTGTQGITIWPDGTSNDMTVMRHPGRR